MLHSTVTEKGQTTIPREIRKMLGIEAGDVLRYAVADNAIVVSRHSGSRALKGALASKKGADLSFNDIRQASTKAYWQKKSK